MAFLDNSGDIILDAVLTDTGRFRLAKGNGNFRIAKFALADDEIDYSLYNKDHSSGSAYYDLEILQSPVLEAFTNNGSSMKSKLMTISRTDILYLPVIKINDSDALSNNSKRHDIGAYLVAVDKDTEDATASRGDVMYGENVTEGGPRIRLDQGIDNDYATSPSFSLSSDLIETQYEIKIDNRFGHIASLDGTQQTPSFIDDDNIATYIFTLGGGLNVVDSITTTDRAETTQAIRGPRGTRIIFYIGASLDLNTGTYLFDTLGSLEAADLAIASGGMNLSIATRYIDTLVTVQGVTTGYKVDVPVRFIKQQ